MAATGFIHFFHLQDLWADDLLSGFKWCLRGAFFVLESTVGLLCCSEIRDDWLKNLTSSCWRGSLLFPAQQRVKYFAATIRQRCWVQHKHRQVKKWNIFCRLHWFSLTLPLLSFVLVPFSLKHKWCLVFSSPYLISCLDDICFFLLKMELLAYQIMMFDPTLVVGSYILIEKKTGMSTSLWYFKSILQLYSVIFWLLRWEYLGSKSQ